MNYSFDLIVLGAGSGGLAAAKRASSYGARVALVEGDRVGGTCVIRGCVPKKLLLYGSNYSQSLKAASSFGVTFENTKFDAAKLLSNVRDEVSRLSKIHMDSLVNAGVKLIPGWGSFLSQNSISVTNISSISEQRVIDSKYILVAVGGRPTRPNIPGSELAWVSDDLFLQRTLPKHIVIVGAGYIACEFSTILNGLGVEVTQIVRGDRLLRGFDHELAKALELNMIDQGIKLKFGENIQSISGIIGDLKVTTGTNDIDCNAVLFATGRKPFLENLGLDIANIKTENERIIVDDKQTTNVANIFAVGDVTDNINLTPVAIEEGRAFADSIFGESPRKVNHKLVAKAVFSDPEIASIGLTELEANKLYGENLIRVYTSRFRPMSKALFKTGSVCFLKLIVKSDTDIILGCHMAGEHSAEIIQMASIAIGMAAKKEDFDKTMALHPTIAEEFVTMR